MGASGWVASPCGICVPSLLRQPCRGPAPALHAKPTMRTQWRRPQCQRARTDGSPGARARADRPCPGARQVDAGAWGTQAMNLQGFYLRGGVDSTAVEAQFNYTRRANEFQAIGGAQFLSTFFDVPPPQNLLPSTYQVLSQTLSICLTLPCPAERAPGLCRRAAAASAPVLRPSRAGGLHAGGQRMWARAPPKYLCTAEASRCRAGQP